MIEFKENDIKNTENNLNIQNKPKKTYQKNEVDLIGTVIERQKYKVYRHHWNCKKLEEKNEQDKFLWECDKGCFYGNENCRLFINCENKPEVKVILCYKDKIEKYGTKKVWDGILNKEYIDKRFLFTCHLYSRDYKLINWKELPKK